MNYPSFHPKLRKSSLALILLCCWTFAASAEVIPLLPGLDADPNASVQTMAVQADGNILIGGNFTNIAGFPARYLCRLTPQGKRDFGFHTSSNGAISHIVIQQDGKIILAGSFTVLNGSARNGIARLEKDGSLDPSFFGFSIPGTITAIQLKKDGKIIAAGVTTTNTYWLVQLSANGTMDSSFQPTFNGEVSTIAVQPDGNILIGGNFTQVNSVTRNRLARLLPNSTLDLNFNPDVNGKVSCINIQADTKILLGGDFTQVGTANSTRVARLFPNGTIDSDFSCYVDASVKSIQLQTNGKILISGSFTDKVLLLQSTGEVASTYHHDSVAFISSLVLEKNGQLLLGGSTASFTGYLQRAAASEAPVESIDSPVPGSLRWIRSGSLPEVTDAYFDYWNGSSWQLLQSAVRISGTWSASGLTLPEGTWIRARASGVSGQNNGSSSCYETITPVGKVPDILLTGPTGTVLTSGNSTVDFGSSDWLMAGTLVTVTITNTGLGELNSLAATLTGDYSDDFILTSPTVSKLAPGASTTLTLQFLPRGGGTRSASLRVASNDYDEASFDVSLIGLGIHQDASFNPSFNSPIDDVALLPDGSLLAAGRFTQVNGQPRNYLARLNSSGALDPSFTPVFNSWVNNIHVQFDDKILVVGNFVTVNGNSRNNLARLNPDGSLDTVFNPTLNSYAHVLRLLPDGKILVTQTFTDPEGASRYQLLRLNQDGSLDGSFNSTAATSGKYDYFANLVVLQDGKILVTGRFTSIGGVYRRSIARLMPDGTLDTTFTGPNTICSITSLAVQSDGKILLAGEVKIVNVQCTSGLIRLQANGNIDSSFDVAKTGVKILGLLADGKILISAAGNYTDLLRINPDGSLDPYFNTDSRGGVGGAAIAPDGKIVVGGSFSTIGGVPRNGLARLPNNIAAAQSIQVSTPSAITWNRSGSTPEIQKAVFERWNGETWISLGEPSRFSAGWSLSGLSLGQAGYLRARGESLGHVAGGLGSSLIEQIVTFNFTGTALTPLQLWRIDHFGIDAGSGDAANANDFDHDGVPNLIEFALGSDPTLSSRNILPVIAWEEVAGQSCLTMSIHRPSSLSGINYIPEYSENLRDWYRDSSYVTVIEDSPGLLKVRITNPESKGFLRLSIGEE
jgi:uncharacterized delta-60 repeat protein